MTPDDSKPVVTKAGLPRSAVAPSDRGQRAALTVDVAVVGAGPAGAVAARELARAGCDVLLVDKARFPRDKVCGSCLGGAALAHLEALGIPVPTGRTLHALRVRVGRRQARIPLPAGQALSRRALDRALVDAAVAAGARLWTGVRAQLGAVDPDSRVLHIGGDLVRARLVLAADGLAGGLLPVGRVAPSSRVGVGATLEEHVAPGLADDEVDMVCGATGYLGMVRDESGRVTVAAALDRGAAQGGVARALNELLASVDLPPLPASSATDWRGTAALTRARPRLVERVLPIGDAAGYVEPFTGEGIGWALGSARAVVPLALEGWSPGLPRRWADAHRRAVRSGVCRATATVLRRPRLLGACLAVLAVAPGLATPVLRRVQRA